MAKSILAFRFINVEAPVGAKFNSKSAALANDPHWFIPADEEELALNTINAPTVAMVKLYNSLNPSNPVKKFSDRNTAAKRLFAAANATLKEEEIMKIEEENIPENVSEQMAAAAEAQAAQRKAAAEEKARKAEEKKAEAEARKIERAEAKAKREAEKAEAKAKREAEREEKRAAREAAKALKGEGSGVRSANKGKIIKATKVDENGNLINPRRPGSHGHNSMQIIINAGAEGIKYEDFIAAGGRSNDLNWDIAHDNVSVEASEEAAG